MPHCTIVYSQTYHKSTPQKTTGKQSDEKTIIQYIKINHADTQIQKLNNGHGKREKGGNAFARQTMKERKKKNDKKSNICKKNKYIHT